MFQWLHRLFTKPADAPAPVSAPAGYFTTDDDALAPSNDLAALTRRNAVWERIRMTAFGPSLEAVGKVRVLNETLTDSGPLLAMDDVGGTGFNGIKAAFALGQTVMPEAQAYWYGTQGFIGYQMCAIIAQQWLVNKACTIPARDAVRKGYKVTVPDGTGAGVDLLAAIEKGDKKYRVRRNLVEFAKMGRVFGVRVAMCKVRSADPEYYQKPFNPDGVLPGTYEGIVQIDPYWVVPELTTNAAMDPSSIDFYEPSYWILNGKRVHRSHLVIMRGPEVADILKPSYLFGGMPLPQLIYERVYAAERCANEAPQLMLTKRSTIFYTDIEKFLANQPKAQERMEQWRSWLDNYGVKLASSGGDKVEQHDTTLADLDANIMTQYQLVAAVANIPATKLLGTSPKGFGAAGDYEIENYHEELESIQSNDLQPLLERHHVCLIRSDIAPRFTGGKPFDLEISWNPLDTPTAEEAATMNKTKADTDAVLVQAGIISADESRERLAHDPLSGYDGLPVLTDEDPAVME